MSAESTWAHPFGTVARDDERSPAAWVVRLRTDVVKDDRAAATIDGVHRSLAHADCPYVVPLANVERGADRSFAMVYAHAEGVGLPTLLREGPLPVPRALAILRQICRALAAAHALGVNHRALSPASVLIGARGRLADAVQLVDFGLGGLVESFDASNALDLHPMTPERVLGFGTQTSEDVYLAGCVAYWMLAGAPPFTGPDVATLRRRHAIEDAARIPVLRRDKAFAALEEVLASAMAKDPDDRFADMTVLEGALVRAQREAGITTEWDAELSAEHASVGARDRPATSGVFASVSGSPFRGRDVSGPHPVVERAPGATPPAAPTKPQQPTPPPKTQGAPPPAAVRTPTGPQPVVARTPAAAPPVVARTPTGPQPTVLPKPAAAPPPAPTRAAPAPPPPRTMPARPQAAPPPPRPEPKVEPKVEAKPEPKVEPKVEAKPAPKAEPKVEAKPEPKVEAKVEPKIEPKVEPKPEPAPREDPKVELDTPGTPTATSEPDTSDERTVERPLPMPKSAARRSGSKSSQRWLLPAAAAAGVVALVIALSGNDETPKDDKRAPTASASKNEANVAVAPPSKAPPPEPESKDAPEPPPEVEAAPPAEPEPETKSAPAPKHNPEGKAAPVAAAVDPPPAEPEPEVVVDPTASDGGDAGKPKPKPSLQESLAEAKDAQKAGKTGAAIDAYEQALRADPKNRTALTALTRLHFDRSNYKAAVKYGKQVVDIAPSSAPDRIALGDAYFRMNKLDLARTQYEKAAALGDATGEKRLKKLEGK